MFPNQHSRTASVSGYNSCIMSSTSSTKTGCASNPTEAASFRLLDLPRELRERIYIAVIRQSASPPSYPVSMADRVPGETLDHQDQGRYEEFRIIYPRFPLPSATATLLTLSRQVHAEVKGVISRMETTRPLIYKLDCMMVDERHLYPTWLSVPALSSSVDIVEANFRLFGKVTGRDHDSDWRGGDGGLSRMHWKLFNLLDRFLRRGPEFLSPPKSGGVKIGELVLNVLTPEEPSEGFIPLEELLVGFSSISREGLIHPEEVVRELELGLRVIWGSGFDKILQESVGIIRLCLDGQEVHTWDVKEISSYLPWDVKEISSYSPC